jgi:hypothetical protein
MSHKVTAAGSRNVDSSAVRFITENANGDLSIKAYGSYADVDADSVSSHFHLAAWNFVGSRRNRTSMQSILVSGKIMSCLNIARLTILYQALTHFTMKMFWTVPKAKKHVLCEKPVTLNTAELRSLLAAAK